MADLLTRAQIALLADLLDADAAALSSLERLGADGVHALRNAISDALFDSLASRFALVSRLAHEDRAVGVLSGMKPTHLADAARYVDPRVIPHFAPNLPARLLIPTAKELLRRHDYLTASRFVEYATEQHIIDFEKAIDDEGLIRTAALVSRTDVLNDILRVAGPDRLVRMAAAARDGSPEFVVAVLSVLDRVEPELASPAIDELFGNPDTDAVSRILDVAARNGALVELLDLAAVLTDGGLGHLAAAPVLHTESFAQQVGTAADTADRRTSWKRLEHAIGAGTEPAKALD